LPWRLFPVRQSRLPRGSGGSVEFALALGRPLVVEPGRTAFSLRTLLGLGGAPLALLGSLCVFVRDCRMFRRAFALLLGLVMFLRCGDGMSLGFLAMSGDLTAKALAFAFALTPGLGPSPGREQYQPYHDHDGNDDGDYSDR
jgi:hypothetical protein